MLYWNPILHYFIGSIICYDVHKRSFLIITVAADQINILYDSHYNLHSSEAPLLCVYTRKYIMFLLFKALIILYCIGIKINIDYTQRVWQYERRMTVIKLKFDVCDSHTWFSSRLGNLWCYAYALHVYTDCKIIISGNIMMFKLQLTRR